MAVMGRAQPATTRPATGPAQGTPVTGPGTRQPGGPGGTGVLVFDPSTPRIGATDPGVGMQQPFNPSAPGSAVTDPAAFGGMIPGLPGAAVSDANGSALLAAILGLGDKPGMLGGAAGGGEDPYKKKSPLLDMIGA